MRQEVMAQVTALLRTRYTIRRQRQDGLWYSALGLYSVPPTGGECYFGQAQEIEQQLLTSPADMLNRRCLIHSKLYLKSSGSKKKQMVVAQSGIPSPGDMSYQAIPAQIKIFKESYNPSPKNSKAGFQNPKLTISLEAAYISVVGLSQSGSRISRMCTPCTFSVTTSEGTCYEFMAEKESERLVWVTVLEFLSMFPYSSVPEVPRCNPLFRRDLDPGLYNADTAWPVYILPEEVGSRCSIIGSNILTLHGRVEGSRVGKLEIYNPTDSNEAVITWDHDKIRRTGKLGRLLFIEIGRRCRGGPGLVWLYMGTSDRIAFELRDTLRRFLFNEERPSSHRSPPPIQYKSSVSQPTLVVPAWSEELPSDSEQTLAPPIPPLRRSTSSPADSSSIIDSQLEHNYHILEDTPCSA